MQLAAGLDTRSSPGSPAGDDVDQDGPGQKPGRLIGIDQLIVLENTRNQRAETAIVKYDSVSAGVLGLIQGLVSELNETSRAPA